MSDNNLHDLISVIEAAHRAGVARNTIYNAAKQGLLQSTRIGRSWFIHASDIERWKEEHYRPDMALRYPPEEAPSDTPTNGET